MTSILAPTENATGNSPREGSGGDVHSEKRDMLLRRCASLALKARVERIVLGEVADAVPLGLLLVEIASWEPGTLTESESDLAAITAAALEDLRAGLVQNDLTTEVEAVDNALAVLRRPVAA
jgi:hypothetical protein